MKKICLLIIALCILFVVPEIGRAQSSPTPSPSQSTTDLQNRINELQAKVNDLQGQEKTLSSQIAVMDNQINLTELRIDSTKRQISDLALDIDTTTKKIDNTEKSLEDLSKALINRVVATYISGSTSSFQTLLSSSDITDLVKKTNYLKIAQAHDRKLIFEMTQAKNDYTNQKTIFEDKKTEAEQLQADLTSYSSQLEREKSAKNRLLAETKGSEAVYQQQLQVALAEKAAIEKAIVSGVQVGPVKAGDPIALVGNSGYPGCSSGKHLHLEIRKNGSWVDPAPYFQNKSIKDEQNGGMASVGSGSWPWPISDPIALTQYYGQTPYSYRYAYSGGIHTGFDMYSTSDVIRAPADGTLYKSTQSCGSSSPINVVYIDHGDNLASFYLHVQ